MNDNLQTTLNELLRSGSESNHALNTLLRDYQQYHVVLAIVGGLFLLAFLSLSVWFWNRFTRARRWSFASKTFFAFGVLSVLLALSMGVIVAANVSNALNPRQGFSGSISMLGTPRAGTPTARVHRSVDTWLHSSSSALPPAIEAKVGERLAWQRPKALISTGLLVVFIVLTARIWRRLIRKSRPPGAKWSLNEAVLLGTGVVTVSACLLLMLMVMGNTQASFAPLSLTLFYG